MIDIYKRDRDFTVSSFFALLTKTIMTRNEFKGGCDMSEKLEVMETKEGLTNNHKTLLIMGGGMLISAIVGYVAGGRYTELRISNGLERCFKVDPNLESAIKTALETLKHNG